MREPNRILAIAAIIAVAAAVPATLYAENSDGSSDSMTSGGMMGGGNMMGRMGRMMDHCNSMMQGGSHGGRPNDQWRNGAPSTPDKDH